MYANVVRTRFKSEGDLSTAVEQLAKLAEGFDDAPGFERLVMVRTGPTETVHTVVFDDQENLEAARAKMQPVFEKTVGPHVAGPPVFTPGPVLLER